MNIHEQCLINYLKNPLNLFQSTELLRINNVLIEEEMIKCNYAKYKLQKYTGLAYNN